ncbi:predicted protein [Chaetomium globosum CBS 148.51]|uniref:Uncharacterized protein n=1 Tax=Chaetomium globosum (strain ATCC 6205 / CBS 148.51 / DSM 1962 / NBRC 6347 / NRRL 1970) TaxID=306901 RepID=Q2H3C5_CHAGB|nr:uncharacterized protein CHGG_03721 [Chaetomium globosum CBS 148.51]EAQ87102.1 predicted protein [Chaetomium globosum CBS 148.51]
MSAVDLTPQPQSWPSCCSISAVQVALCCSPERCKTSWLLGLAGFEAPRIGPGEVSLLVKAELKGPMEGCWLWAFLLRSGEPTGPPANGRATTGKRHGACHAEGAT